MPLLSIERICRLCQSVCVNFPAFSDRIHAAHAWDVRGVRREGSVSAWTALCSTGQALHSVCRINKCSVFCSDNLLTLASSGRCLTLEISINVWYFLKEYGTSIDSSSFLLFELVYFVVCGVKTVDNLLDKF